MLSHKSNVILQLGIVEIMLLYNAIEFRLRLFYSMMLLDIDTYFTNCIMLLCVETDYIIVLFIIFNTLLKAHFVYPYFDIVMFCLVILYYTSVLFGNIILY